MERLGAYTLGALRGDDALWRIYDAVDGSGGAVVVKLMHPALLGSPASRAQLVAGLRALAAIRHPGVSQHLDVVDEAGRCALVVAPVTGETLRDRLARDGRLPWPEAIDVATQIASGLAAVHTATPTILHGDLQPEHLIATRSGWMLVDFDFSWAVKGAQGSSTAGFRNLRYMSPEAIDAAGIEPRSDLYVLGILLWEMLTGAPPFSSMAPLELLNAQCTKPPPPLPEALRAELPVGTEALLRRLLEKSKESRPGSALEVVAALEGLRHGRSASVHALPVTPTHAPTSGTKPKSALPIVLAAVGGVIALAGAITAFVVLGGNQPAAASTPAPVAAAQVTKPDEKPDPIAKTADPLREPEKPEPEKPEPDKPEPEKPEGESLLTGADASLQTGIPECDEYMAKYLKCLDQKVPEDARKQARQAFAQAADAWRKAAAMPGAMPALRDGCRIAIDAAQKATTAMGCTWD